jgi:hypothetical protein
MVGKGCGSHTLVAVDAPFHHRKCQSKTTKSMLDAFFRSPKRAQSIGAFRPMPLLSLATRASPFRCWLILSVKNIPRGRSCNRRSCRGRGFGEVVGHVISLCGSSLIWRRKCKRVGARDQEEDRVNSVTEEIGRLWRTS